MWTDFVWQGTKRSTIEASRARDSVTMGKRRLFSSLIPRSVRLFFFFCACLVIRPFSLIRSLVPGYPLKFPLCTSAIFTFRSSTVETQKRLFSYRHNQSPQLQENYRL